MKLPDLLVACRAAAPLRFVLIGGHAVIAHGYARTTFDVDLLVSRTEVAAWLSILERLGYRLERQQHAFAQLTSGVEGEELDLMIVNEPTFTGMWQAGQDVEVGSASVKVPSLDHLLALKLHVMKQDLSHRVLKDLDDVIRLVLVNHLDVRQEHYRKLFEKYGNPEDYTRVLRATAPESV